ncbi:hypothetical protein KRE49_05240 [Elizabethkingia meningoseptica]|nr:hypothetical protein [Elizabethkingia meningoseptica]MDE5481394.1 hypothetical protein [Elizabethkingia meningoseptica]MDE5515145.1 hypothetical protein [Elizabethkingia meningoseptica]MDN4032967.1 hypothetical protein [Elizabethkingia meningoseptica]
MQKVIDVLSNVVKKGQVVKFYAQIVIHAIEGISTWLENNAPNQPKK